LLVGYFVFTGLASGIWLVAPLTIAGIVALVLGYESIELKKRFPDRTIRTILDYPENKQESASFRDRFTSLLWIGAYLIVSNFMINTLNGNVAPALGSPLPIIPFLKSYYWPFLSVLFLIVVPFLIKKKAILREWEISGFIALSISAFIAFLYPTIGAQYFLVESPALIAIPVFLLFISLKAILRQSKRLAVPATIFISLLIIIQLINCRSAILNLTSTMVIYLISTNYLKIWIFLKNQAEKIANSWEEWIFGKIRVINHGFYVGFGAFLGVFLAGILAGSEYAIALLVFTFIVNICAALWAQIIEGSAKLKRPFGYYGGVVGIVFGSIAVWGMGFNVWIVIGVASVVMPWTQAIGRLRCLVNGCCHGRKIDNPLIGIRYFHPRSRVCNISGLKGELVHPTQLYAILWLTVLGIFLLTLWVKGCSAPIIFGLYLILTSLGRFVEEAYRGEVQTPISGGMHLYQWTAIISLIVGIIMTTIQITPAAIHPGFNWESVGVALISGLFVFFAMGVDFPYSNVRFSRLV
ncbi:MAG TPA: prolipoprotein diacylglyceryl transferase family protein, partial [Sunxiuqinia sp.]|nr:prolipoprotein diacylglyceryl transferase family protein [Sunxiuqinia sp.]